DVLAGRPGLTVRYADRCYLYRLTDDSGIEQQQKKRSDGRNDEPSSQSMEPSRYHAGHPRQNGSSKGGQGKYGAQSGMIARPGKKKRYDQRIKWRERKSAQNRECHNTAGSWMFHEDQYTFREQQKDDAASVERGLAHQASERRQQQASGKFRDPEVQRNRRSQQHGRGTDSIARKPATQRIFNSHIQQHRHAEGNYGKHSQRYPCAAPFWRSPGRAGECSMWQRQSEESCKEKTAGEQKKEEANIVGA